MRAFADTSFWYALAVGVDANHDAAVQLHREQAIDYVVSRFVIAECMSLITKRFGKPGAVAMGSFIRESPRVAVLEVTSEAFDDAWRRFAEHLDWDFALVDAISFAIMRDLEIETALTFDHHFAQMGCTTLPA